MGEALHLTAGTRKYAVRTFKQPALLQDLRAANAALRNAGILEVTVTVCSGVAYFIGKPTEGWYSNLLDEYPTRMTACELLAVYRAKSTDWRNRKARP